jgi:hypothetical protein
VADSPDGQQLLTALTTEHFTLQGARAQTLAESSSRATVYVGAVSSSLIALGFIGQVSDIGTPFRVFALIVLPTLYGLGIVTHIRLVECGVEDVMYGMAINRIRGYYRELAGDQARLFLLSGHDDARGVFENAGVPATRRPQIFSFASVVAAINGVVGGSAVGIAVAAAFSPSLGVTATAGGVAGTVSIVVWLRVAAWILARRVPAEAPLYPSPPAGKGAPKE